MKKENKRKTTTFFFSLFWWNKCKSFTVAPMSCFILTESPRDAHFHRQSCVQGGTLDHDTQHPEPCGGVCVQVRENL